MKEWNVLRDGEKPDRNGRGARYWSEDPCSGDPGDDWGNENDGPRETPALDARDYPIRLPGFREGLDTRP